MGDIDSSSTMHLAEAALGYFYKAYLENPEGKVHSDDVALALHVDKASAINACHHLADQLLVEGESGVRNTQEGPWFEGRITAEGVSVGKATYEAGPPKRTDAVDRFADALRAAQVETDPLNVEEDPSLRADRNLRHALRAAGDALRHFFSTTNAFGPVDVTVDDQPIELSQFFNPIKRELCARSRAGSTLALEATAAGYVVDELLQASALEINVADSRGRRSNAEINWVNPDGTCPLNDAVLSEIIDRLIRALA